MDKQQKDELIDLLNDFESWLGGIDMMAKIVKSLAYRRHSLSRLLNLQKFSKDTRKLRNKIKTYKLTFLDDSNSNSG